MTAGNWRNSDGLYLQYGTQKAVPTTMGVYMVYGDTRELEFTLTPSTLTTSPVIQDFVTFFESNVFVESVTTVVDNVACAGGTSISIGLMNLDGTTVISNTAFLAAAVLADHTAVGQTKIYTNGVATGGAYLGTVTNLTSGGAYITALAAGTYTGAGTIKVRIRYRGFGTITQ